MFFVIYISIIVISASSFRVRNVNRENIADLQKSIRNIRFSNAPPASNNDDTSAAAAAAAADAGSNIPFVFDKDNENKTDSSIKNAVKKYRERYRKMFSGFDMRPEYFNINSTYNTTMNVTSDEIIFNYVDSFKKKDLLDKLEDPNIPNVEKLRLLGEKKFLYDDW